MNWNRILLHLFSYRKWLLHRFIDNCLASSIGSNTSSGSNACDRFVNMEAIDLNMDASFNGPNFDNAPDLINQPDYNELMRKEMNVCKNAADNHPCNYNAWSHRIWVLQHCFNCSLQVIVFDFVALKKGRNMVSSFNLITLLLINHIEVHKGQCMCYNTDVIIIGQFSNTQKRGLFVYFIEI